MIEGSKSPDAYLELHEDVVLVGGRLPVRVQFQRELIVLWLLPLLFLVLLLLCHARQHLWTVAQKLCEELGVPRRCSSS